MRRIIVLILLSIFIFACAPAPTPKIIVITVVVLPTMNLVTNTSIPTLEITSTATLEITPTVTPNPCLLWDQVTLEMVGQTICVRGIIRKIENSSIGSHWDFTDNRTGFFAISSYLGWHPITGKDMSVGDCNYGFDSNYI